MLNIKVYLENSYWLLLEFDLKKSWYKGGNKNQL